MVHAKCLERCGHALSALGGCCCCPCYHHDVIVVVCRHSVILYPYQPREGRGVRMTPTSQATGHRSRARDCVWWLFGWVTLGRLLALSEPISSFSSQPVGQARRSRLGAGLMTRESQATLTPGPTTSEPPPLRPPCAAPECTSVSVLPGGSLVGWLNLCRP